jgi:ABC-2 type transport system ATP-binding protein
MPSVNAASVEAVSISGVSKRYAGQREALRTVSLSIHPGECVGLIGLNGAGKSTLLKCILDLARPDGGEIRIFGMDSRLHQARRELTYLPERMLPPHYMTGRQFLDFARRMQGGQPDSQRAGLLNAFDLEPEVLKKPVRQLSKGMAQKLALAAVLESPKKLFMLDEPASGLDPLARYRLRQRLMAMKGGGITLLVTSHLLEDLSDICDRLAVLHEGQLRFVGTVHEMAARFGKGLNEAFLSCIGVVPTSGLLAQ